MDLLRTPPAAREYADSLRANLQTIALVPTMGALHEGHLTLVKEARGIADIVIVSVFVNPTQFGPGEDFDKYPRDLQKDLDMLSNAGVNAVFTPDVESMYHPADRTSVMVSQLDKHLCGAFRPDHFLGVTSVVTRLFLSCKPHFGVFGLKDAQQFFILKRMVSDLHFGIELVGVPTVREPDGLAMSSRNRFLTEAERKEAPVIHRALLNAKRARDLGEQSSENLTNMVKAEITAASGGKIQYASLVETDLLQPVVLLEDGKEYLLATAVFFGDTRLIDNVIL